MDDPKAGPEEMAFWMQTDARCTNTKIGSLLGDYLFDALTPQKRETFEQHLEECMACDIDVTNWMNLDSNEPQVQGACPPWKRKAES